MQWAIEQGDAVEWARTYQGAPFHALLCDPPYEYKFMGRAWDGSGVAFNPETWAALATHLYPGAFGMAFASSRGWHRLAAAIEDAGLIIHPSIFGWAFGSGFPKATRVPDERFNGHRYGLQAMKPALEPVIVFQVPYAGKPVECIAETGAGALWIGGARIGTDTITAHGGSSEIKTNEIYGSYKELERGSNEHVGRWPANFALIHSPGCNGPCVAGCPVREMDLQAGDCPSGGSMTGDCPSEPMGKTYNGGLGRMAKQSHGDAGGPSRFFLNADWMLERLESESPVFYTGKATSAERDAGLVVGNVETMIVELFREKGNERWEYEGLRVTLQVDTAQSAPRVIGVSGIQDNCAIEWNTFWFGNGKTGLSQMAIKSITETKTNLITDSKILNWLTRSLTNGYTAGANCETVNGGSLAESAAPFSRSLIITNREEVYLPGVGNVSSATLWRISVSAGQGPSARLNGHPCIKPLSLVRWLATLLLPPVEYAPRRLLVPFSGAGSEMIGAGMAGWELCQGIELNQGDDYIAIAEARLKHWLANSLVTVAQQNGEPVTVEQMRLL